MEPYLKSKMILSVILSFIVTVQIVLTSVANAYRYDIFFRDEDIFSPCDDSNVKYVPDYLDMSDMKYEFFDNHTSYIHGDAKWIRDFGTLDNMFTIETYRKQRDSWVSTIYNMRRKDFCRGFFGASEFWHMLTKDIKDQTCPIYVGQIFNLDITGHMTINLPDSRVAGQYKSELRIRSAEYNEVLCAVILTEVYRS